SGLARYDVLSPSARVRLALEPLVRSRRGGADESVGAFFRRRFGPETVNPIAAPLLGGIHAGDIDSLSIRSLFPRFVEAETQHGSAIRSFRSESAVANPGRPRDGLFRSLIDGMEELVSALERRLPSDSLH